MKKWMVFLGVLFLLAGNVAWAEVVVGEAMVTTEVVNRNPVDVIESYSAQAGKLFCFTRIDGAPEDTFVTHIWYWGDKEMAQVDLAVRSSRWRTYSSKNILPEWKGQWRVDVLDAQGKLLKSLPFSLI